MPAMQFSGMIDPVSSLEGVGARDRRRSTRRRYFLTIARGTFSKALGFADLQASFVPLLIAAPLLIGLSAVLLQKAGALDRCVPPTSCISASRSCAACCAIPMMLVLIVFAFTFSIYSAATAMPETLNKAPIAIVDEDRSPLSARIADAFYPPYFMPPVHDRAAPRWTRRMDAGLDTFALDIPPDFQRDVLAGRRPTIQLNVDATRMSQAFTGSGLYPDASSAARSTLSSGATAAMPRCRSILPCACASTRRCTSSWFGAVIEVINRSPCSSIILTGAALIREREHGTIEHLLVMPVTPLEIMAGKIWSMGLVVLVACALVAAVRRAGAAGGADRGLDHTVPGRRRRCTSSPPLLGMFLATIARSMPQFGLLLILVLLPLRDAVGRHDAAREHARGRSVPDAGRADDALHHAQPGDPLPRRRISRRCGRSSSPSQSSAFCCLPWRSPASARLSVKQHSRPQLYLSQRELRVGSTRA